MWKRCRHDWEIADKTVLPSAWQQMTEHWDEYARQTVQVERSHPVLFQTKVVLLLKCKNCHRTKVLTESNP